MSIPFISRGASSPTLVALVALAFSFSAAGDLMAQDTKISGYMFGDFYYVAQSENSELEDRNGFWFRRIYATLDQKVAEGFSVRLRGEMMHAGNFESTSKMIPIVKDAYLKYKKNGHEILLGLSTTPTWSFTEKQWGYRSVEKTALDLYKFGSSRDMGIAAKGPLAGNGRVTYHVMVANGASTGTENNKGKKVLGAVQVEVIEGVAVEVYADFEARPDDADRYTFQGLAVYNVDAGRLGVQFARQTRKVADAEDMEFDIVSVFGAVRIHDRVNAFGRFDRQFQPNPSGESISYFPFLDGFDASFVVAGIDFEVNEKVRLQPNVEVAFYEESDGVSPSSQIMPRATFYYKF